MVDAVDSIDRWAIRACRTYMKNAKFVSNQGTRGHLPMPSHGVDHGEKCWPCSSMDWNRNGVPSLGCAGREGVVPVTCPVHREIRVAGPVADDAVCP